MSAPSSPRLDSPARPAIPPPRALVAPRPALLDLKPSVTSATMLRPRLTAAPGQATLGATAASNPDTGRTDEPVQKTTSGP